MNINTKGVRSVIDLIRDAPKTDLIIVSLFLLPILMGSWSYLLKNLDFLDQHTGYEFMIICFVFAIYILGLIVMKCWNPLEEKLKRARYHIENILKKRIRASFEYLKD